MKNKDLFLRFPILIMLLMSTLLMSGCMGAFNPGMALPISSAISACEVPAAEAAAGLGNTISEINPAQTWRILGPNRELILAWQQGQQVMFTVLSSTNTPATLETVEEVIKDTKAVPNTGLWKQFLGALQNQGWKLVGSSTLAPRIAAVKTYIDMIGGAAFKTIFIMPMGPIEDFMSTYTPEHKDC